MQALVTVAGLTKKWPGQPGPAVDDVSFELQPGEVMALLGPNGAGKTTTAGIITTRIKPDAGTVTICGFETSRDPHRARGQLAAVPQKANLDRSLTARQVLTFHGAYFGMSRAARNARADQLLEDLGLAKRAGHRTDTFSGGMAQRLLLARALMHAPRVLVLDEPTTGLDPNARRYLRETVRTLAASGVGILLCSHDIAEVELLCDRVGVIDTGKLLALDTVSALRALVPGGASVELSLAEPVAADDLTAILEDIAAIDGVERADVVKGARPGGPPTIRVSCTKNAEPLLSQLATALADRGAKPRSVTIGEASLEDAFFHLTGKGLQ